MISSLTYCTLIVVEPKDSGTVDYFHHHHHMHVTSLHKHKHDSSSDLEMGKSQFMIASTEQCDRYFVFLICHENR